MAMHTTALKADVSALLQLFAEFSDRTLEVRNALVGGLHALGQSAFATRVDPENGAADASQLRVVFEPSDALLDLASALRAGDVDGRVVQ